MEIESDFLVTCVLGRDYTRLNSGAPFGRKQIVQWLKFEAAACTSCNWETAHSKLVFAPAPFCLIRMARDRLHFMKLFFAQIAVHTNMNLGKKFNCAPGKHFCMTSAMIFLCRSSQTMEILFAVWQFSTDLCFLHYLKIFSFWTNNKS